MRCSDGHHTWAASPPVLGTPCLGCPRTWTPRGFQFRRKQTEASSSSSTAPSSSSSASSTAQPRNDRLMEALARFRLPAGPSPLVEATPAAAQPPATPAGPSRFAQHMGARLARLFDAGTDALVERFKRTPDDADETDLADFEEAAAEIIQRWMPDSELGPYGKLALASAFIVGGKWVGGEPIARPIPAGPVHVVATSTRSTAAPPPSPPSSSAPDVSGGL